MTHPTEDMVQRAMDAMRAHLASVENRSEDEVVEAFINPPPSADVDFIDGDVDMRALARIALTAALEGENVATFVPLAPSGHIIKGVREPGAPLMFDTEDGPVSVPDVPAVGEVRYFVHGGKTYRVEGHGAAPDDDDEP